MSDGPVHFFDLRPDTFGQLVDELSLPRHTTAQVFDWVYGKGLTNFEGMTNLAHKTRQVLADQVCFFRARPIELQVATDGTQKILMDWSDRDDAKTGPLGVLGDDSARQTECVMIPSEDRKTACISSQIGCPVGCSFCASGLGGLDGNLTSGQIVEQAYRLGQLDGVGRISNVVFMGMGEPLANYGAVTGAIRTLNATWGMGVGARRITLSTVGLPTAIRRLIEFDVPITLALSLHAPNDDLRRQLIPWAEYASISDLLDACQAYFAATGREVTLEYILLGRVNDQPSHAEELATVARRLRSNINLIRYNEVEGLPYVRPRSDDVYRFQELLRARGVNVHIRASRGRDIAAACGQLRHEHLRRQPPHSTSPDSSQPHHPPIRTAPQHPVRGSSPGSGSPSQAQRENEEPSE